jgi:putative ABC transport system substrate-binding protein
VAARGGRLRRREFIALLGGVAAWPLAAREQQAGKLPTIGFLASAAPATQGQWVAAFVRRLRDLGWIEGHNLAIEYRWAEGRAESYTEIAAEFVRLKIDIIVGHGTEATVAARQATSVIPIVFPVSGDPVGARCPPKTQRSFLRNGMMPIAAGRALGRRHRTAAHRR